MGPKQKQTTSKTANAIPGGRAAKDKQKKQKSQGFALSRCITAQHEQQHVLSANFQQLILNVFIQAFPVISHTTDVKELIQRVKGHLYNREFLAAFGKQEYLEVYALRWSAARALAYADIFTHPARSSWLLPLPRSEESSLMQNGILIPDRPSPSTLKLPFHPPKSSSTESDNVPSHVLPHTKAASNSKPTRQLTQTAPIETSGVDSTLNRHAKILCIGGGAGAEIVALTAAHQQLQRGRTQNVDQSEETVSRPRSCIPLEILAVDIADWSVPVQKLSLALDFCFAASDHTSWSVQDSRHLSETKDSHCNVKISFSHQDILQSSGEAMKTMLQRVTLVTIMFTLNELFSASLPKTTALLLNLTEAIETGAHLVVVDSPGSYSEIKLGKASQLDSTASVKKYPMKWLLDHTLLDVAGKGKDSRWTKIEDEDSKWFRIDETLGLRYGVELENTRCQIHVFRKL